MWKEEISHCRYPQKFTGWNHVKVDSRQISNEFGTSGWQRNYERIAEQKEKRNWTIAWKEGDSAWKFGPTPCIILSFVINNLPTGPSRS